MPILWKIRSHSRHCYHLMGFPNRQQQNYQTSNVATNIATSCLPPSFIHLASLLLFKLPPLLNMLTTQHQWCHMLTCLLFLLTLLPIIHLLYLIRPLLFQNFMQAMVEVVLLTLKIEAIVLVVEVKLMRMIMVRLILMLLLKIHKWWPKSYLSNMWQGWS